MFSISVQKTFTAAHRLTLADGSKESPHSHDWIVVASVSTNKLDRTGIVMDFLRLQAIIDNITSEFLNANLEQLDCFQRKNSSAENVAKYIYDKIASTLPSKVNLDYVQVTEAPGCIARYCS